MESNEKTEIPRNKLLEYLKSIEVNSTSKHEEIENDKYLISVVMFITKSKTSIREEQKCSVSLLCVEKEKNITYDDLFLKEFTDLKEADSYYQSLLKQAKNNEVKIIEK